MRDLFDVAVKGINERISDVDESCEKKLKSIDTKYLSMVQSALATQNTNVN